MQVSEGTLAAIGAAGARSAADIARACLTELSLQDAYAGTADAARCDAAIRAKAEIPDDGREGSLKTDLIRIGHFLARSQDLPRSGGFKALARAARRFCGHPAARHARERMAERGNLTWPAPEGWPSAIMGYACAHLGSTAALASESSAMANCVADFEDGCAEGHYAIASLRPLDATDMTLARCSLVLARLEDGSWEEYGLEAARHLSPPRSAKEAAGAIIEGISECR